METTTQIQQRDPVGGTEHSDWIPITTSTLPLVLRYTTSALESDASDISNLTVLSVLFLRSIQDLLRIQRNSHETPKRFAMMHRDQNLGIQ